MLLFFDVETTGLPKRRDATYRDVDNWPRIVSISWALFEPAGGLRQQREAIIRPEGFEIPEESTRVHGITTAYASKHGKPLKAVLEDLAREIRQEQPALLVAHNMAFDRNVVMSEFLRAGTESALVELPVYCTMESSVDICRIPRAGGGYKWPRLEELHTLLFGEDFPDAHNAAADVLACARCYFALQNDPVTLVASPQDADLADDVDEEAQEMVDQILDWATDNPWFDTDFIESVNGQLSERGWVSERQRSALENIIDRFDI